MQYANNVRLAYRLPPPLSLPYVTHLVEYRKNARKFLRFPLRSPAKFDVCVMRNGKCKLNKGGTCSRRVDRFDCQVLFIATTIRFILRGRTRAASRCVLTTLTAPRNKKKKKKRISRNAKQKTAKKKIKHGK